MTRSPRHVAAHPGTRACVHVAFVLLVVLGIAVGGAGTAAAVGATRPAQLVADSEFLPQDSDGTGDAPATSLPEPTAEICEGPGPSATVVAADGTASDAGPVYRPGSPIRVTGGGWCIGGRPAQGEQVLRARLVAVGGYVSHEKTTQTVVFADGAFDTTIRIADLYAHLPRGAEDHYYLSVTLDSRAFVGSNQFQISERGPWSEPSSEPADADARLGETDSGANGAPASGGESDSEPGNRPADPGAVAESSPGDRPADPGEDRQTPSPSSSGTAEPTDRPTDQRDVQDVGPTDRPTGSTAGPGTDVTAGAVAESSPGDRPADPGEDRQTPSPSSSGTAEPTDRPTDQRDVQDVGPTDRPTGRPDAEPTPAPTPATGSSEDGGAPGGGSSAVPRPTGTSAEPGRGPDPTAPTDAMTSDAQEDAGRPSQEPSVPVRDASELNASNAGSLSGTRHGNVVSLILPSGKAKMDDWVAVFLFPGDSTPGWTQVDADNSVSIDVSNLSAGTYQLAVIDRDSLLLGWAQLEITTAAASTSDPAVLMVETTTSSSDARALGRDDWMLVSAGGLLLVGAASFLVLARSALTGRTT